jgi:hypothetical protein
MTSTEYDIDLPKTKKLKMTNILNKRIEYDFGQFGGKIKLQQQNL